MNRLHRYDVLAAWFGEYLNVNGYRPRTHQSYMFEIGFFRRWLVANTTVSDIDEIDARVLHRYLNSLHERSLCAKSIHAKSCALICFFGTLFKENKLYTDLRVHIGLPRTGKSLPTGMLSEANMAQVWEYLEQETASLQVRDLYDANMLRDAAMMELLYGTGVRISELIHIDRADVDSRGNQVLIRQGKGGNDRIVPLGKSAAHAIERYLQHGRSIHAGRHTDDALLVSRFGNRLSTTAVRDAMKRVLDGAGITVRATVHGIRHSCATHMLDHGADIRSVQELLGHRCLSSTQIYTHVSIDKLKKTHARHHPREKEHWYGDRSDR